MGFEGKLVRLCHDLTVTSKSGDRNQYSKGARFRVSSIKRGKLTLVRAADPDGQDALIEFGDVAEVVYLHNVPQTEVVLDDVPQPPERPTA